jgi:YfiR/HmsC-like
MLPVGIPRLALILLSLGGSLSYAQSTPDLADLSLEQLGEVKVFSASTIIGFRLEDRRFRFEVKARAAALSHLQIGSHVLSLARVVLH